MCHFRALLLGFLSVALLSITLPAYARAETIVPITGIGTRVAGAFTIDTHVDSVTYSDPEFVAVDGVGDAIEIRGTVSGIGWGGGGIVARANNAHYAYQIPFVARWRANGASKDLVVHHHGGSQPLLAVVLRDKLLGAGSSHRRAEFLSDLSFGVPSLLNHCAYIAANRRGVRGDGTFSATYLPAEIPPLTQAEVGALNAAIGAAPGNPNFQQPGIAAGAPVPLVLFNDAPTFRDIARALEQVVAGLIGKPFRTRICSGVSSGAQLASAFEFGRSVIGPLSVRTGGNLVVPYDQGSRRIFDGFIFNGFVYDSDVERADTEQPISAPALFIQGRSDERYQQPIRMAHELLTKGVPLNDAIRIYEVKGLTHVTRDNLDTVQPSNGDRLGCFVGAAIRNMGELLREGCEPPVSRIAGRIQGGALVIDQASGSTTRLQPIVEDPAIDSLQVDPMIVPRLIGPAETARWLAVTAVLAHEADAITPPTIACRVGGYKIRFFGAGLVPFAPEVLAAFYGDFHGYRESVEQVVADLTAARLYDNRVESAKTTAELSRTLFAR